ncbi:MAG TPA: EAL domain-containing protein, partial [Burkholderiaceae bacterium]|nr:EAL domain-containing protein [Burkholderiaceae bacterium]
RDLMSVELPQLVYDLLHKFDVPHKLVTLEITESSVMEDPERALSVLQELHRMGVRLSIDDFGTGFSSLAYLKKLPVDEIKIDRTFVHRMIDDADDRVIVRSTIELAHSLGLKVVAEGVESEQCLDVLRSMGCDIAQGYYFSPGMRRVELERWLQTSRWGQALKTPQVETV